jgi:hypothetical protein
MRNAILALLLSMTTAAVGQYAPAPLGPVELGKMPAVCSQNSREFSKLPWSEPVKTLTAPRVFHVQGVGAPHRLDDAQIDPMIVAHPPPSSLGVQPAGKLVAKNEFPGLELLPIEAAKPAAHAVPRQWPGFKLQSIPATWPKFEMVPVQAGTQVTLQPAAGK